jgi:hypothetical protein
MSEERKNYHVALVGYEPEHNIPNTSKQARIYFKRDTQHFLTRQEQMEFLDNNESVVEAIKKSDVLKLLLDKASKKKLVNPIVELMLYYEGETGRRIYFDEMREIDVGLGRFMQRSDDNKKYTVVSHRGDMAILPNLFK